MTVAVLWDLDGTLVDSAADIAAAIDRMLGRHGLPVLGEATVRRFIGEGARRLVDRCVAEAGAVPGEVHLAHFLAEYRAGLVVHTHVEPPALRELLDAIDAPQAIVTNKPEALTHGILAALDLARHFPVVLGGDSLPTRKPDPAMLAEALRRLDAERGVLVGDGPADVGAARAAGMPMIGVGWGIAAPEGADVRVGDVDALADALVRYGVSVRGRTR